MTTSHLTVGPHQVEEWADAIGACDAAVSPAGLHMVIRVSSGVADFALDVLDDVADRIAEVGIDDGPAKVRQSCLRTARLVTSIMTQQDERLAEARSGALIRLLVQGDNGAIFCQSVVPGQFLVGYTVASTPHRIELAEAGPVHRGDQAISRLATALRKLVGLGSQNPGSYDWQGAVTVDRSGPPVVQGSAQRAEYHLLAAAVDPVDLHFVCLATRGRDDDLVLDHFGHQNLRRFHGLISIESRRKVYYDLARELPRTFGQLSRLLRGSTGGSVRRLVLDVELGAVYCYHLGPGSSLVGATLDQEQVLRTDRKLAHLAVELVEF